MMKMDDTTQPWDREPSDDQEPETTAEAVDRACWSATIALSDVRSLIARLVSFDDAMTVAGLLRALEQDAAELNDLARQRADAICAAHAATLEQGAA